LVNDESWGYKPTDPEYGKLTHQALIAVEIKELYTWWKEVYPNRPDPYDISGWSAVCAKKRTDGSDIMDLFDTESETPDERAVRSNSHNRLAEIEAQYEQEEDDMLIRLIKVRKSLWT
jgi:hypothetical protein